MAPAAAETAAPSGLRIVKFYAQDVLRLKAVEVTPQGDLVVVGGRNDAGKSSVLNAIVMAMGGAAAQPDEPVRRGAKTGKVVLDLGDVVVALSVGRSGDRKLVVSNKAGTVFKSPQAMLDRLWSSLTGDPLAFERMDRKRQAEMLRLMVGLDTADLDADRARLYDERTQVNRSVAALQVQADAAIRYPDAPADEVSVAALVEELRVAGVRAQAARGSARALETMRSNLDGVRVEASALRKRLADLDVAEADLLSQVAVQEVAAAEDAQAVPDEGAIRAELTQAEGVNRQVRTNRQHRAAVDALQDAQAEADRLSRGIDGIDAARAARLAAVQFPVPGLGVDEDGVTLDGLPFSQASTSSRIRASVGIALAQKPGLRVLLVRDGSLLGDEKFAALGRVAAEAGVQVWLEMLQAEPDARTSVFIEDGQVRA